MGSIETWSRARSVRLSSEGSARPVRVVFLRWDIVRPGKREPERKAFRFPVGVGLLQRVSTQHVEPWRWRMRRAEVDGN
jgi:hypothetical protein